MYNVTNILFFQPKIKLSVLLNFCLLNRARLTFDERSFGLKLYRQQYKLVDTYIIKINI